MSGKAIQKITFLEIPQHALMWPTPFSTSVPLQIASNLPSMQESERQCHICAPICSYLFHSGGVQLFTNERAFCSPCTLQSQIALGWFWSKALQVTQSTTAMHPTLPLSLELAPVSMHGSRLEDLPSACQSTHRGRL